MHYSVFKFFMDHTVVDEFMGKRILDIGSFNENGSLKEIICPSMAAREYIGTDMRVGPGVDLQLPVENILTHFGPDSMDVIISTEALEHMFDWKLAINNMKRVLNTNGILFLTTRSVGFPLHSHPDDYWRFSLDLMGEIFKDFDIKALSLDFQCPGVFIKAIKPAGWDGSYTLDYLEASPMEK